MDCFIARSSDIIKGFRYYPVDSITSMVYQNTTPGSPLRRHLVEQHIKHGDTGWLKIVDQPADYNFLMDLAMAFMEGSRVTRIGRQMTATGASIIE
jgi:hypothetical protein